MDENRRAAKWGIQYTDNEIYAWGYLPTTYHITKSYISEITRIYAILELLEINFQIYQLHEGEVDIICDNE